MGIEKRQELPRRLAGIQRRIERWRQTCKVRSRIPDSLWAAAVRMAGADGVNRDSAGLDAVELPGNVVIVWCDRMLKADRVGFIYREELQMLHGHALASRS